MKLRNLYAFMMEANHSFRKWRIFATSQRNLAQVIALLSYIRCVPVWNIKGDTQFSELYF